MGTCQQTNSEGRRIDIRFPWIHKREPLDSHSQKVSFWKNHSDVPSWRASHAMLWFADGSRGESHLRRLSCIWVPKRTHEAPDLALGKIGCSLRMTPVFLSVALTLTSELTTDLIFRFSAAANLASSCVSLSSLFSASSISVLPTSLFSKCSEQRSVSDVFINKLLTRPAKLYLLRRNRENGENLYHYLNGYIPHGHGQRHLDVGLEALEI